MKEHENQQREQFELNAGIFQLMAEREENEKLIRKLGLHLSCFIGDPRVKPHFVSSYQDKIEELTDKVETSKFWDREFEREFEAIYDQYFNED